MFAVFALAAADPAGQVCKSGFEVVLRLVSEHARRLGCEMQSECAACVGAFLAQQAHEAVALRAAECLADLAAQLRHGADTAEPTPPAAA